MEVQTGIRDAAWAILAKRIEQKTSWGRVELRELMRECLESAIDETIIRKAIEGD